MRSGRFEKGMADNMQSLNASIGFDKRFWREDIEGSKAWARGLLETGFLSAEELEQICDGLDKVAAIMEDAMTGTPFETFGLVGGAATCVTNDQGNVAAGTPCTGWYYGSRCANSACCARYPTRSGAGSRSYTEPEASAPAASAPAASSAAASAAVAAADAEAAHRRTEGTM